jgi:uncharacterized coiled-coil protein SlyX
LKILLQLLSSDPGGKEVERQVAELEAALNELNEEWSRWQKERAKIQNEMGRLRKQLKGADQFKAGIYQVNIKFYDRGLKMPAPIGSGALRFAVVSKK